MARNVVITGGNSGIGKEMARALAHRGDHVIIASRRIDASQAAVRDIQQGAIAGQIKAMALDLADFASIDRFAAELSARMPTIDVLILNAGLYTHGTRRLDNGFEAMIGIMHFGHFRLTQQLLPAVKAASQGRIVVTSSLLHRIGRIDEKSFHDPAAHRMAVLGYAQAKLANLLFTRALARRLANTSVTVNAFHPGSVATGIWQELPSILQRAIGLRLIDTVRGADTGLWLASAPKARSYSGKYFYKRRTAASARASRDEQLVEWLWDYSERQM